MKPSSLKFGASKDFGGCRGVHLLDEGRLDRNLSVCRTFASLAILAMTMTIVIIIMTNSAKMVRKACAHLIDENGLDRDLFCAQSLCQPGALGSGHDCGYRHNDKLCRVWIPK